MQELHAALLEPVVVTMDDFGEPEELGLALTVEADSTARMALVWRAAWYSPGPMNRLHQQEAWAGQSEDLAARAAPPSPMGRAAKPVRSWDRAECRLGNWPAAVRALVFHARADRADLR